MPTIRFLADESCDYLIVSTLRAAGHDVLAIVDTGERSVDTDVIDQAYAEKRILLTEDKDFGWHVFVSREHSPGVILIRFPASMRLTMAKTTLAAVESYADRIATSFLVIQPGHTRLQKLP
jgi:predicted nuclease of predicted toxin-antitoxin system